jgi:hypothetical protein
MAVSGAGTEDIQCIEPPSGLIDSLTDEISWVYFVELFFTCAERVVDLSIRHRAALKPAIKDLFDTSELSFSLLAFDRQMVNVLSVQISDLGTSQLFKLFD